MKGLRVEVEAEVRDGGWSRKSLCLGLMEPLSRPNCASGQLCCCRPPSCPAVGFVKVGALQTVWSLPHPPKDASHIVGAQ